MQTFAFRIGTYPPKTCRDNWDNRDTLPHNVAGSRRTSVKVSRPAGTLPGQPGHFILITSHNVASFRGGCWFARLRGGFASLSDLSRLPREWFPCRPPPPANMRDQCAVQTLNTDARAT